MPPLNALRAFEAAARCGTMTAAADELCVTPGAISRQVRQLETYLGVSLFEGSKSKPQRTQAASVLLVGISAVFDQIEASVRAVDDGEHGTLDVACYSTFTVKWLIPRLYSFRVSYPDIEVRLSVTDAISDRTKDVALARYDLLISVGQAINSEGREAAQRRSRIDLFPEYLGPVLAPSLALALKLRKPSDLMRARLLQTTGRLNAWQMWSDSVGTKKLTPTDVPFEHYYFTLEAAIAGLGVCVAPWHLVMDDIAAGRLLAPFGFRESGYRYVAVRRTQSSKKLDRFCEWLTQQVAATSRPPHPPK